MTSWDRVPGPASWVQLRRRRLGRCLAGAIFGFALTFAAGGSALQAADLAGSFRGNAFATFANAEAGPVAAQLGRSAYQPCPCRGTNGEVLSNTINDLQAGDDGKVLKATATLTLRGTPLAPSAGCDELTVGTAPVSSGPPHAARVEVARRAEKDRTHAIRMALLLC